MKRIENYENVQASSGDFARPTAGGYVCVIMSAKDVPFDKTTNKGDYLKIEYDILEGEFKGYYSEQFEKWGGNWNASFIRSYKEKALGMFKHFTNCIEESNVGYKWAWNESTLKGTMIGLVLGEEEYINNNGEVKKRLYVKDVKTVEQIRNGDFKIPELKTIKNTPSGTGSVQNTPVSAGGFITIPSDEDLPFN